MAQYIDKAALVAEIERIKKSISPDRFLSEFEKGCNQGKEDVCNDLLSFLDTIVEKDADEQKQQWIEKACEWLKDNTDMWIGFIDGFKKAMKGE